MKRFYNNYSYFVFVYINIYLSGLNSKGLMLTLTLKLRTLTVASDIMMYCNAIILRQFYSKDEFVLEEKNSLLELL